MHFHCEVYLEEITNFEAQVEEVMEPFYYENGGFWDWYEIGGRWKGAHVPGYNPNEDPDNMEVCDHYGRDAVTCPHCHGTDKRLAWPTQWQLHEKDVIPVSEIPAGFQCATLIVNGTAYHYEVWEDGKFKETPFNVADILAKNKITNGFLVTVDYHD